MERSLELERAKKGRTRTVYRFYKKLKGHVLRAEHSFYATEESIAKRKRRGERLLTSAYSGGWNNNSRVLKVVK